MKLLRDVAAGELLTATDAALDGNTQTVRIRRDMERPMKSAGKVMAAE